MKKRLGISFLVGLFAFIVSFFGIVDRFDYFLTDALYQRPVAGDSRIKIIALDEKSFDKLGPYNTWDRTVYANLINTLCEDSKNAPNVITFDMIFQGETDKAADEAFAAAAKNGCEIVSAANMVLSTAVETDENGKKRVNKLHLEFVEYPYDGLRENSEIGFANTISDDENYVRQVFPYLGSKDEGLPSLALATAIAMGEEENIPSDITSLSFGESVYIRYVGRPGDFEAISLCDVLDGKIPPEVFKGSTVFVGAYAPGMMDSFSVPTGRGSTMYGVEVHANILQAMLTGRYMFLQSALLRSLIYGLISMLLTILVTFLPLLPSAVISLAIILAQIIIGIRLANAHVFMPLLTLPVFIILINIGGLAYRYFLSLSQRRKVLKAFRQYVAPQVVEEIAKKGDYKLKLGGEKRNIAVLFVDIRGFTPLSESLKPEEVVKILNEYLSLTTKAIFDNGGTLDKFVGDATMAVFNSPFDVDDYIFKAVCAARDIVAGSEEISKKAFEMTGKTVGFGVGVNCGEAVVGNIGCDFRMDYTAIGDTVNTAARLEANAPAGKVYLSPSVVEALGDRISTNPVGEIPLKGKSVPLMVHELLGIN